MLHPFRLLSSVLVVASLTGCASVATLAVANKVPIQDQSVPTPQKVAYTIIMVLPPKGSERGEVSELAHLEKALLKQGVRVISSGVTGRVVIDNAGGQKNEGAAQLTDLERALVLARKSGAEALLQVAEMKWVPDANNYRFYALQADGHSFAEVSKADFEALPPSKQWSVTGPSLHFEAKLIDVETGEIVTAVDIAQSTVREVTAKTFDIMTKGGTIVTPGAHEAAIDTGELRQAAAADMMGKLASIIAEGKPREVKPSARELALEADHKKLEEERANLDAERKRMAEADARRAEEDRKRAEDEAKKVADTQAAAKKAPKRR